MSRENRRKSVAKSADPPAVAALERRLKSLLREAVEPAYPVPPYLTPAELYDDWPGTRRAWPHGYPQDRKHGQNWPVIRNETDLRQARAFSRFLADTNPLVIGFVGHVGSYVVGGGFKWSVGLKGVAGDDPAEKKDPAVMACQKFLDEFRQLNGWGDVGEIGVGDLDADDDDSPPTNLEMEGWESAMEDGELFLRLFQGGAKTNGVPTVRKVNPECVYCPPGETTEGPWSFGIETDPEDRQRRLAYHVADPDKYPQDGEIVPASRIVHMKLNAKTDVKRGVPDFWPLEKEAQHLRKLWQNMAEVTAILSAIAYIRQHAPGVSGTQIANMNDRIRSGTDFSSAKWGDSGAGDIYRTFTRHESGTVIDITNGMQFQPPPAVAGLPGFIQGMQATLRIFGLRWGCPEYFSGDASNANFASTLVAGGPFERATIKRQQQYKRFQGNLATRALLLGVKAGRLTQEQVMRVSVQITPPAVAIANKAEDTGRRVQLMQAAGLSKRTVLEEEGYDPDREAANAKKEAAEQQPPQPPGDPGAGQPVPQGGPTPDQGGGELDLSGLAEQLFAEGVVWESTLVKKKVTDKTGKQVTRLVRADGDQPADPKTGGGQPGGGSPGGTTVGGEAVPDEVAKAVNDPGRLKKFGLRVASALFRAESIMQKVGMPALEAVFDTPSDLEKFGYAATSVVDAGRGLAGQDPIREHLGVSAHLAASLIGKAATAVLGAIKKRRQAKTTTEALEGMDELVGLWREILTAGHELLGLPKETVPSEEQIRAGLEALTAKKGVSESFNENDHPRDDNGRFVSSDAIADAKNDPTKAKELRDRVTDPAQRAKLDAVIGSSAGGSVKSAVPAEPPTPAAQAANRIYNGFDDEFPDAVAAHNTPSVEQGATVEEVTEYLGRHRADQDALAYALSDSLLEMGASDKAADGVRALLKKNRGRVDTLADSLASAAAEHAQAQAAYDEAERAVAEHDDAEPDPTDYLYDITQDDDAPDVPDEPDEADYEYDIDEDPTAPALPDEPDPDDYEDEDEYRQAVTDWQADAKQVEPDRAEHEKQKEAEYEADYEAAVQEYEAAVAARDKYAEEQTAAADARYDAARAAWESGVGLEQKQAALKAAQKALATAAKRVNAAESKYVSAHDGLTEKLEEYARAQADKITVPEYDAWLDAKYPTVPVRESRDESVPPELLGLPEEPVAESYSQAQYRLLSEADRSHLVFDKTKSRWVNPNKDQPTAAVGAKPRFKLNPRYKTTSRELADKAVEMGRANPARATDLADQLVTGLRRRFRANLADLAAHHGDGAEAHPYFRAAAAKDAIAGELTAVRKAYLGAVKSGDTAKLKATLDALISRTTGHIGAADSGLEAAAKTGDLKAGGLAQKVSDAGSVAKAVAALGREDDLHPEVMTALTARVKREGLGPADVLALAATAPAGSPARAAVLAALPGDGKPVPFDPGGAAVVLTPELLADLDDDQRAALESVLPSLNRAKTLMGGGVQVFHADGDTLTAIDTLLGTVLPTTDEWDGLYDASPQSEKIAVAEVPAHAKTDLGEVSPDWDAGMVTRYKRIDKDHYIEYDPATSGAKYRVVKAKDVPPLIGVQASVMESVGPSVPLWYAVLEAVETPTEPVRRDGPKFTDTFRDQ